jgi:hypothetical protein
MSFTVSEIYYKAIGPDILPELTDIKLLLVTEFWNVLFSLKTIFRKLNE